MAIESLECLDIQHVFGAKLRLAPDDAKPGGHNGWNGGERVAVFLKDFYLWVLPAFQTKATIFAENIAELHR